MSIYIEVLTLFPQLFAPFIDCGIVKRAVEQKHLQFGINSLREFGIGRYRAVDSTPYGGGAGMVLRADVLAAALKAIAEKHTPYGRQIWRILLTPQGQVFHQALAKNYATSKMVLILICGRYEGFDERVHTQLIDQEISLGDFICQGGEAPAMSVIEATVRLVPGVLGNPESNKDESFTNHLLEYPQYTHPEVFQRESVPPVLLSGHHQNIHKWRKQQSEQRTAKKRPDLLETPQDQIDSLLTNKPNSIKCLPDTPKSAIKK